MTNMADLFSREQFLEMVDGGYVRIQNHPSLPYQIANYSEKAQYEHVWNAVTTQCRGLIYRADTVGDPILARPYAKFFNYGDTDNTGPLDLDAHVIVTDKLDGSLGISYPTPDGPAIATRGSFTSDQALHATAWLRENFPDWEAPAGITFLFEIIYPENRIVVDYGDRDELVCHGALYIETGEQLPAWETELLWPGTMARRFHFATLADALAAEPRPNAEGFVVTFDDGLMVKIKQEDYVALHRIVTGLNAKTVWEWLGDGNTVGDLCATLPDEFHGWVEGVANELYGAAQLIETQALFVFEKIKLAPSRREFAEMAMLHHGVTPYLFLLLDGKNAAVKTAAWREVKPSGARTLINHSEAVA